MAGEEGILAAKRQAADRALDREDHAGVDHLDRTEDRRAGSGYRLRGRRLIGTWSPTCSIAVRLSMTVTFGVEMTLTLDRLDFHNFIFSYDPVGNPTQLQNQVQFPGGNLGPAIGGPWSKTFSYDGLFRPTTLTGVHSTSSISNFAEGRGLQPGRTTKAGTVTAASTHLSLSRSLASPRLRNPDGLDRFACGTVTRSLRSRIRHPRSRHRSFRTTRAFLDECLISETGEVPFWRPRCRTETQRLAC